MHNHPVRDLNKCSVKNCKMYTEVIIQKTLGEETLMFGYCNFHSIISATLFPNQRGRKEIHV